MLALLLLPLLLAAGDGRLCTVTAYVDHARPMASGRHPYVGACAGPRWVPLGTVVLIGGKRYVVEDRTHKRFDGRYDLFMWSRQAALRHGAPVMTVTIIKLGKGRR
jgi:3D (Asp-Asp-Asp) domain-containing protein